tara:strand:- start:214 stop:654 length:441 start_codon:yes stop_codon:yes gene_type:complete
MPKQKPLSIKSKSAARIAAVQIFYNKIISNKSIKEVYQDYKSSFKCELENDFKINSLNEEFLDLLLLGFNNNIDKEIEKLLARDWKLNRISAVNKSILFAGIIELNIQNDLTDNIIISEYLEIAEQMGGDVKFINKILDKISKDLK